MQQNAEIYIRGWSTKIGVKSKWDGSLFIDVKVAIGFELNMYETCWF